MGTLNTSLQSSCHPESKRFVGDACSRCYYAKRRGNPDIRQRANDAKRRWRQRHPEKHAAQNLKGYYRNHESRKLRNRERYQSNRNKYRKQQNSSRYGITTTEYDVLFLEQNGLCSICGLEEQGGKLLSVDHCHESGKVRGLLCNSCNGGLGLFRDNPILLEKALAYINKQKKE